MAVWSVVSFAEIPSDMRFEAEYFQPKYLELEQRLKRMSCDSIDDLSAFVRSGPFGSNLLKENYVEDGVVVLRPFNIKNATVESNNLVYITEKERDSLGLTNYLPGDIAFARVGDIGCGIVPDYQRPITISPNIIISRPRPDKINPAFLAVYMNSRLGSLQMERAMKVVAQPTITVEAIKAVLVPRVPRVEQDAIADKLAASIERREQSAVFYAEAEALLHDALGLDTLNLSHELTYEGRFRDMMEAERMDAQYFHPEKRQTQAWLNVMPGQPVSAYCASIMELYDGPKDDTGAYVYNYDLTDALRYFLDESGVSPMPAVELGSTKKRFQRGDVVVSRLRSYLKEIAVVNTHGELQCVGSSEFIVLRPHSSEVTPELLMVFLRSQPVQSVLKWCQDGSQHPRFKEDEILSLNLPDVLLDVQPEVTRLIKEVVAAHQDAKQLLEEAKRRVEEMILG